MITTKANETRAEILDTIRVCEDFLANAAENEGKNLGPLAHVFSPEALAFAKAQIAFERGRLAELDTGGPA